MFKTHVQNIFTINYKFQSSTLIHFSITITTPCYFSYITTFFTISTSKFFTHHLVIATFSTISTSYFCTCNVFIAIFSLSQPVIFYLSLCDPLYHLSLLVLYLSLHHHSFHKTCQKSCYKDVTEG